MRNAFCEVTQTPPPVRIFTPVRNATVPKTIYNDVLYCRAAIAKVLAFDRVLSLNIYCAGAYERLSDIERAVLLSERLQCSVHVVQVRNGGARGHRQ